MPDGIEGKAGYTPYEFIDFTDIQLKHELVARVERPISEVYALWENRLNWPEWFGMIEEVGFKEGDDDVCALNLWYRWAMTPWLELYVALRRTQAERDKYFVEEPEDGAPLVAAVLFQEEEGSAATLVTLRVSYLLPRGWFEFAGQLVVYGDVDRKLTRCRVRMKEWVESVEDVQEKWAAAAANMADIRAGLPEHRKLQQEADARFEEQKRREEEQEEKEQQQAEEAAAAQATADLEAMAAADLEAAAAAEAEAAALPPPPPKAKRGRKATGPTVTNPMAKRRSRKDADMEP
ncbi:hypothetical protein CHLNCDRAFT_141763 [Chlorella variabilis]|uniref:Coenzyme Q-binding protein COQ10 START domain-containing protein n=1 Tax=Chlorella variabilis TaxID=554065 RepID=E1ZTJ6_CHLVA|nr:hypothetical protein CHLNCDRAFT_141763 [Chlorella variabilis]EFN50851.1 hypothetical protein CHLNCDRAFT_141763 [Chlorella variabilis]|eukprot:XP_005842953.1 hypothetical protein CHLNCDRAFT_141763 [Chlorella variabilis]